MTANAGYKTFNTGDVLTAAQVQFNLQNQTVMYFATTSARTTALSGVTVEGMVTYIPANGIEYYNGTAWIGVTSNASNVPNLSNPVLNSAFQVWQRGTSFSLAASTAYGSGFTADRWQTQTGANQACTISRQATSDTTNLPNIQYNLRYQRNSGQTGTNALYIVQNFETINSIPFAGKTVTFSFYARAGANFSSASNALSAFVSTGTGTDQNSWAGYTGSTNPISGTATLTTTWQRFSFSGTIPATATEMAPTFGFTPTGTAGANDYYEITGVQLEIGSVATPFDTYATTIQGELAACQRYYWRTYNLGSASYYAMGSMANTTKAEFLVKTPVTLRSTPSSFDYTNLQVYQGSTAYSSGTWTYSTTGGTLDGVYVAYTHGSAVFTAGYAGVLSATSGASANTSYVGFSAEL
jgi:hypothetical protein